MSNTQTTTPPMSLSEIEALLAGGAMSLAEAHAYLAPRAARPESRSALRAAAWLKANPLVGTPRKAPAQAKTPKPGALRLADGRLVSAAAWEARSETETYADAKTRLTAQALAEAASQAKKSTRKAKV